MADLAASSVTYTLQEGTQGACPSDPRYSAVFKLAFGDGALLYPSGGIPLTLGKLGCPSHLQSFELMDQSDGSGYLFKYDRDNAKLRIYQSPVRTHAHDLKIIGGQASTTTNELGHYATDILGKEAATDATIAKADSATKGGVISETLAAAALSELGNVAVAAQVLYAKVVGW